MLQVNMPDEINSTKKHDSKNGFEIHFNPFLNLNPKNTPSVNLAVLSSELGKV